MVRLPLPRGHGRARRAPLGPADPDRLPLGARCLRHHRGPLAPAAAESMTIAEPMTLATDYLLGGITGWLCLSLLTNKEAQRLRLSWGFGFAGLALVAFF